MLLCVFKGSPMKKTLGFLLFSVLSLSPPAAASGFLVSKMGGDLSGPTEPNAAAVFWNPAALGPIEGASAMLDMNFIWRDMNLRRLWPEGFDRVGRADDPGRMQIFAWLPMPALTVRPGLDWLTLGFAVYAPFGNRVHWPYYDLAAEMEKPPGERLPAPAQAYQSLTGEIETYYTTAAAAFCPFKEAGLDWLWAGVNISWVRAAVAARRLKDFAPFINEKLGAEIAPPEQLDFSGEVDMRFSGNSFAFAIGFWAQPTDWLRAGLSWTSGSQLRLPGRLGLRLPALVAQAVDAEAQVASTADLRMDLPPAVRAGVHLQPWWWLVLRLNVEYVHWQLYRDIRIENIALADENGPVDGLAEIKDFTSRRDFHNAVDARFGARFYLTDWWMVFAGAGYDTNAIGDETVTADLYDADKLGLSAGSWVRLVPLWENILGRELDRDDRLALCVGFNWIIFFDRTVRGSQADPPLDGDFRSAAYFLNLNLDARF